MPGQSVDPRKVEFYFEQSTTNGQADEGEDHAEVPLALLISSIEVEDPHKDVVTLEERQRRILPGNEDVPEAEDEAEVDADVQQVDGAVAARVPVLHDVLHLAVEEVGEFGGAEEELHVQIFYKAASGVQCL